MSLRLSKLRDRTPIRMSILLDPDTHAALQDYAAIYAKTYGAQEKPETLIPAMLENFLSHDAGYKRARRALQPANKGD